MDEFYSDNFFDGNAPIGWSERDWFDYLKSRRGKYPNSRPFTP